MTEAQKKCPDDGTCHHACPPAECFRVRTCAPLSAYGEEWSGEIVAEYGGEPEKPTIEDVITQ